MPTHTIVKDTSHLRVKQLQTWDEPSAAAQIGDEIRAAFTPLMQVVDREVLADGRVRLLVKPVSASYPCFITLGRRKVEIRASQEDRN